MLHGILGPAQQAPHPGRLFALGAQFFAWMGAAALLLSWLAPNHYPPWTSFHSEAPAFVALGCFLWARLLTGHPVRLGSLLFLFLPLAALIALQWAGGQILYGGDALLSVLYVLAAALAFWLGQNEDASRRPDAFSGLAAVVVAGACLSVLVGVLQWHRLEQTWGIFAADRGPNMRVFSNLAQPNHLATLCLTGIAMALWLRHRALLKPWQFVAVLAWLSLGVVLTESRAGLVCAFGLGLFLLSGRKLLPVRWPLIVGWWIGLVAASLMLPRINDWLLLLPAREAQFQQHGDRLTMWRQALAAIADSPWVGHGWRQTLMALKQAALEVPGTLVTDYAHNVVLDVLVWVGVPLGVLMLGALAFWLARSWLRIRETRQLLLMAAALPVCLHSLFEFPFAYAYFLFPVAWLLGALQASQSGDAVAPAAAHAQASRRAWLIVCACAVAFCATSARAAYEYLLAEDDYRVMRFELRRVGQRPTGHEAPDIVLLTQLREKLELGRLEARPGMPPELLRRLGEASRRDGWATLDLTYAAALGMNGQPEEATRQLRLLQAVYDEEVSASAFEMFRAFRETRPELQSVTVP